MLLGVILAIVFLVSTLYAFNDARAFIPSSPEQCLIRRNVLQAAFQAVAASASLHGASSAVAKDDLATDFPQAPSKKKSKWDGNYEDPTHEGCSRMIYMNYKGTSAKIGGWDVADGGPCNDLRGGKQYRWSLKGTLKSFDADEMVVEEASASITTRQEKEDGSKWPEVVAKWDGDGILFPDGTKWTKIAKVGMGDKFQPR